MGYFRELPNLLYPSFLPNKTSSLDYIEVKNVFRRVKVRNDLYNNFIVFQKYEIPEGARPDTVAEDLYGTPNFDWVVLTTAGITNIRNEWPLSNRDLYNYVEKKYGNSLNSTRFFETTEVKDSNGRLILPKGKVVDSNFTIPNPTNPSATLNPVVGISNFVYETRLNEEKRNINILREDYLSQFVEDMKGLMTYTKSSEYISKRVIRTENTNLGTLFITS
tara:strand:+ start:1378 stop:2037 length:660 start_codon:yes stop_codon:yes gene_type:complete